MRKIDLHQYASKKSSYAASFRPSSMGVYHDRGHRVVSDTMTLIAVKDDYAPEMEGKSVTKTGTVIDDKYPHWESVLWGIDRSTHKRVLDPSKVEQVLREYREFKRTHESYVKKMSVLRIDTDAYVNAERFDKLWKSVKVYGAYTMLYSFDRHDKFKTGSAIYFVGENFRAALMPVLKFDFEEGEACSDGELFYGRI